MNAYLSRALLQGSNRLFSAKTFLVPVICGAGFLQGCVTPTVTTTPTTCASLLPQTWKQGVAGAELPFGNVIADWVVFADAQTGKLDQANGRTVDAIGIVERCEARDAAAVRSATRPHFLGIKL
jgi:hypothetical protein